MYYFGEGAGDPSELDRTPFDNAFRRLADGLEALVGPPFRTGEYKYRHRRGWPYLYSWWRLPDASLALVQDEHDIQFGTDVTLWVLAEGVKVRLPVVRW